MSALKEQKFNVAVHAGVEIDYLDSVMDVLAVHMWRWFYANRQSQIVKIKTLFGLVSVTVRVEHLKPFFATIFGDDPNAEVR